MALSTAYVAWLPIFNRPVSRAKRHFLELGLEECRDAALADSFPPALCLMSKRPALTFRAHLTYGWIAPLLRSLQLASLLNRFDAHAQLHSFFIQISLLLQFSRTPVLFARSATPSFDISSADASALLLL